MSPIGIKFALPRLKLVLTRIKLVLQGIKLVLPRIKLVLPRIKMVLPIIMVVLPRIKLVLPRIMVVLPRIKLVLPRLKNKKLTPMRFRTLSMALMQCHFDYSCSSWYAGISHALKSKLQVAQNKTVRFAERMGQSTSIKNGTTSRIFKY